MAVEQLRARDRPLGQRRLRGRAARQDAAAAAVLRGARLLRRAAVSCASSRLPRPADGPAAAGAADRGGQRRRAGLRDHRAHRPRLRAGHRARARHPLAAGRPSCHRAADARAPSRPDTSFSAQIGPVYIRMDQLGLDFIVDSGKPPRRTQPAPRRPALRPEVPARHRGQRRDRTWSPAVARSSTTPTRAPTSAPSTSPSAARFTLQAICLVATKQADGTKGFSLIAIAHPRAASPWPLGMGFHLDGLRWAARPAPHLRRGRRARRAADRAAALRAVPRPTRCTTPPRSCTRCRRCSRRSAAATSLGLLVKIGWASPTLIQLELGAALRSGASARAG